MRDEVASPVLSHFHPFAFILHPFSRRADGSFHQIIPSDFNGAGTAVHYRNDAKCMPRVTDAET